MKIVQQQFQPDIGDKLPCRIGIALKFKFIACQFLV